MLAAWLVIFVYGWADQARALPATIAWDLPLSRDDSYFLEVSDTPGFAKALLSTEVRGSGYLWQAPGEGVYHWRLTRPGQKSAGGSVNGSVDGSSVDGSVPSAVASEGMETSYLASGSFVVIDPRLNREQPARISWAPAPGADRYKIYVTRADDQERTLTVSSTSFVLPATTVAEMIEVVPFTEDHRTSRAYQLDPSLKLASGIPAPPPPPPPVPPAPPPPVIVKNTLLIGDQTNHERRRHLVYLYGGGEREELDMNKLGLALKSNTTQAAGGGGLWLNPVAGLIVSGAADYHQHDDQSVGQPGQFSGRNVIVNEARYSADINIGYNILDFFGVERVIFVVSGAAGMMQLPVVAQDFAVPSTAANLPVTNEQLSLIGGSASLGYLGEHFAMVLEGGGMTEPTENGRFNFGRLVLDFYPVQLLAIELGGFVRSQQASRCDSNAANCLLYGRSATTALEGGAFLGVGSVLK